MVICEGAGSPAEINLRATRHRQHGPGPGGRTCRSSWSATSTAAACSRRLFGTLALLDAGDQALVAGFVVNKFRGDPALLAPGLDMLHRLTGRPVLGVLPWLPGLWLDVEDSLDLRRRST